MIAFYNEIDDYCCAWLSNLMDAGHITPGVISNKSIEDLTPYELIGYDRVHLFAGIGVWDYALRLAGWPSDRPVWTLSCPCQPFSSAGKGVGFDDKRHLWPHAQWLIEECKPVELIGEQVASGAASAWIDLVHADLEAMGYAFGCVPFPSAGVGAPHIRDRAYWVADSELSAKERFGPHGRESVPGGAEYVPTGSGGTDGLADTPSAGSFPCAYAGIHSGEESAGSRHGELERSGAVDQPGPTNGFWRDADWLGCRDGKWRPVESGTFPLAHGVANRMGKLRAYGNAINAKQAQAFIECYLNEI
jgi:DNA (cytosine-5)-methyltransferase 1